MKAFWVLPVLMLAALAGCTTTLPDKEEKNLTFLPCLDNDRDGSLFCLTQDCDDSDTTVYPGAKEIMDGKDNDCDGKVDERGTGEPCATPLDCEEEYICDLGFCRPPPRIPEVSPPVSIPEMQENITAILQEMIREKCQDNDLDGFFFCPVQDCDDNDPSVHPGAEEIKGNRKDDNCDGIMPIEDSESYCTEDSDCVRKPACCAYCSGAPYVNKKYAEEPSCEGILCIQCAEPATEGRCINNTCTGILVNGAQ